MVLHGPAWSSVVWYGTAWSYMVLCSLCIVLYGSPKPSIVTYSICGLSITMNTIDSDVTVIVVLGVKYFDPNINIHLL